MTNKESYANSEEINLKKSSENTLYYLETYLNPDKKWNRDITLKQRINLIRYAEVNWKAVCAHIKSMDYRNFLKTPYWKAIADHTKCRAGYRCQLCNSAYDLVTHHRSYNIHGREHDYMHELIVLCDDCHSKFHDKVPKSKLRAKVLLRILIFLSILFLSYQLYKFYSDFEMSDVLKSEVNLTKPRSLRKRR